MCAVKFMVFEGFSRKEWEGTADISIVDIWGWGGG
jgi:hypothetical protein